MNLVHGITTHILYSIWIYIHIYGNNRLIVSDADSLTFVAQSPEECVRCIWSLFCYKVLFHVQSTTWLCETRPLSVSHKQIYSKICWNGMLSFWQNFITDCTGRQLPVQPVMKISSKWYFRFSARASWIILTFRADLAHVYITCCGHMYSYKIQYTSSM